MSAKVAAIILAAGRGARFDAARFKLLEDFNGRPIVRHAVDAALASRARPVVIVTGHEAASVESALRSFDVTLVHNPDYADGLALSLRAGLAQAEDSAGALILLADMPLVAAATLDRLAAVFETTGALAVVPTRHGRRGNPVLIGRDLFAKLANIRGDKGARDLLRDADRVVEVEVDDDGVLVDVDERNDLARLKRG